MNHREFFDQAAADWDELTERETLIRLREIVVGLGIEPGSVVLDVGTGTGVLLPLLLEKESRVVALDFSWEMLKRARGKRYPVAYVQGDAQCLPLKDETFDWVICNAVFPHFVDRSRSQAEISRVLRKGGRLVICHTDSRQRINDIHRSVGGALAHDAIPDEGEMRRLLSEAGLGEVEVRDEPDRYLVTARRRGG